MSTHWGELYISMYLELALSGLMASQNLQASVLQVETGLPPLQNGRPESGGSLANLTGTKRAEVEPATHLHKRC